MTGEVQKRRSVQSAIPGSAAVIQLLEPIRNHGDRLGRGLRNRLWGARRRLAPGVWRSGIIARACLSLRNRAPGGSFPLRLLNEVGGLLRARKISGFYLSFGDVVPCKTLIGDSLDQVGRLLCARDITSFQLSSAED